MKDELEKLRQYILFAIMLASGNDDVTPPSKEDSIEIENELIEALKLIEKLQVDC